MSRKCADYLADARTALGDSNMSDRELGSRLGGYSQQHIWKAKAGNMSDPLALAIAGVLPDVQAGEILWVARMEREKDEKVKAALIAYTGKILAAATLVAASSTASSASGVAVAYPAMVDASSVYYVNRRKKAANDGKYSQAA